MEHFSSNLVSHGHGTGGRVIDGTSVHVPTTLEKAQPQGPKRSLIPEKWGDHVRVLGIAEYRPAALSLAQAFATDELALYLVESEAGAGQEAKWHIHVDIFNYLVAAHCYKGIVTTIGPDYEGVALW
jgi:hypothetical protein